MSDADPEKIRQAMRRFALDVAKGLRAARDGIQDAVEILRDRGDLDPPETEVPVRFEHPAAQIVFYGWLIDEGVEAFARWCAREGMEGGVEVTDEAVSVRVRDVEGEKGRDPRQGTSCDCGAPFEERDVQAGYDVYACGSVYDFAEDRWFRRCPKAEED